MKHPKFVQISSTSLFDGNGDGDYYIFALGEDGEVYKYHVDCMGQTSWLQLGGNE